MSVYLINNVIDNSTIIPTSEKVETILTIVGLLICDQSDGPTAEQSRQEDKEEWEEEQSLMGRLVHLLVAPEPYQQYPVLTSAWKHLSAGGALRLPHTLLPFGVPGLPAGQEVPHSQGCRCQDGEDIQVRPQVTLLPTNT